MDIRIIHFYPNLMNLYGSYANVSVLERCLRAMGNEVTLDVVVPSHDADLSGADFIFMGAGTERRQKGALEDFLRYELPIKAAAESGVSMLFAGTAMELLGKTITEASGKTYAGISLGNFSSVQGKTRFVEDVYGHTDLYGAPVVGFMNKCSTISGITTPLLIGLDMGYGNDGERKPEGFQWKNVLASHLTGPLLVKNPPMLEMVIRAIYERRGQSLPEQIPVDRWAKEGYAVTAEQLRLRSGKKA